VLSSGHFPLCKFLELRLPVSVEVLVQGVTFDLIFGVILVSLTQISVRFAPGARVLLNE